ncbi:enoyl-CoA hydratase/isomerase family protein [Aquiluna borgnonia]|uniref:Enoyl-CoA hydratase/isomerase family protein n=1 Tax=Aquiluna borgnonia TaxID=2499157 RepID=A0A7D4UHU5_9MICO|nr:3-hydroxyacyl-CoA dehydrogenase NAD-binding domain-containing protein [Aquiluna borgnonia]QKJ24660.1 enoyl-CoA hydratase/isomerase family protein [Aquiluna borgnonia]
MGKYDQILRDDEVITQSYVSDVQLASGKTLALITLENGLDHNRPNTLGPHTLIQLGEKLDEQRARAKRGEIAAVGVTGKPYFLAAGADLSKVNEIPDRHSGRLIAELGHEVLGKLSELGVPSFVFINGLALGGGLEIALNANYRTVNQAAPAIALPEVFLGLIPGWGGAYLLPNLIGIKNALKLIIENPLKQNRMLKPEEALELGIADVMFDSQRFLEQSLSWADQVLGGLKVKRKHEPGMIERTTMWGPAVSIARGMLEEKIGSVPLAPYRALDLILAAKSGTQKEAFEREDQAIEDMIASDQFRASIYAFNLVQKHAKKPSGAPDSALAKPVSKVGVIGAGLMASQFALLFLRRLEVPVVITDVSQERVDKGLAYIAQELEKLVEKGRLSTDDRNRYLGNLSGSLDYAAFANCDWVIEAVFEELEIKREVFARIEQVVRPDCILATNTSSLSVDAIGANLEHPERLVGFHFFNPVAVMPLVEVVRAAKTSEEAVATAMKVAKNLKKTAVITSDSAGFVVNRLLGFLLGEAMRAVDEGANFEKVAKAIAPLGLPMNPFDLLELVGLKVGAHVLDSMHAFNQERFYASANLHKLAEYGKLLERDGRGKIKGYDPKAIEIVGNSGNGGRSEAEIFESVNLGLAREIKLMLDEGVVHSAQDIDLCMILGAGWPFHLGGITPYLDRTGASERAFGSSFHSPMIIGVRD